jgi:hypothetical protein
MKSKIEHGLLPPRRAMLINEHPDPIFMIARTLIIEPKFIWSSNDNRPLAPVRICEKTDMFEPNRNKLRMESELPTLIKSKMLMLPPDRT